MRGALPSLLLASLCAAPAAPAGDALLVLWGKRASDRFGAAVAAVGDVDGDGLADFLVGAPGVDTGAGFDAGRVRLVAGGGGSSLFTWTGTAAGDALGTAVAGLGDADGDGYPDVLAGAPSGNLLQGYALALSGRDGTPLFSFQGPASPSQAGFALAGGADLDGDGFPDALVGVVFDSGAATEGGAVVVVKGSTGQPILAVSGSVAHGWLGSSVAFVGDVDLDGVPDFAAGAPGDSSATAAGGAAFLLSGASGQPLHVEFGTAPLGGLGWSVAAAGDVDHDGVPDWAAGVPFDSTHLPEAGSVRVISGKTSLPLAEVRGLSHSGRFGTRVAPLSDVTGDGVPDLLVGAPNDGAAGLPFGRAHVVSIAAMRTSVALAAPPFPLGDFGAATAGLGDVDGDGVGDLLVGAPTDVVGGVQAGAARVFSGACVRVDEIGPGAPAAPELFVSHGLPRLGSVDFAFGVVGGVPTAPALLLVGSASAAQPIPGGTLYVDLAQPHVLLPASLDAAGSGLLPLPVPTSGPPPGTRLFAQLLAADATAPGGVWPTRGLSFVLCR